MPTQQSVNLNIDEKTAQGEYANVVFIHHSSAELIFDFARILPGTPRTQIQNRIIMTPVHSKALLKSLEENIRKYEKQFGEIKLPGAEQQERYFGFKTPGFPDYKTPPGEESEEKGAKK
ncbi:MAG: DUF3467 domain-containing protein [Candidatus Delongbacteria bacterium]|nr:DUF3467 domain-containing protein [Candidatus Delongbacteria bacterium]